MIVFLTGKLSQALDFGLWTSPGLADRRNHLSTLFDKGSVMAIIVGQSKLIIFATVDVRPTTLASLSH